MGLSCGSTRGMGPCGWRWLEGVRVKGEGHAPRAPRALSAWRVGSALRNVAAPQAVYGGFAASVRGVGALPGARKGAGPA